MLDRISTLMPDWEESSPADLGVALVELMACVGDRLSYRQDAVATEAYLETARRRVSVRRHARLVAQQELLLADRLGQLFDDLDRPRVGAVVGGVGATPNR